MSDSDNTPAAPPATPAPAAATVPVKSLDDAQAALDEAQKRAAGITGADADYVREQLAMFEAQIKTMREDYDGAGYIRTDQLTEEQRQLLFSTKPENRGGFLSFLDRILHDPWG